MRNTGNYAARMSPIIQIRDVPDARHRKLKARAALARALAGIVAVEVF
jgi:hypothetical protein